MSFVAHFVLIQAGCLNRFNRTFRDSGAIIVGAGQPGNRSKLGFSSYGSRVDLQGWGSSVVTNGYGNPFSDPDTADVTRQYTNVVGGSASASLIVAGAAVNLQGVAKELFGTPLPPLQLRKVR
jgi:serine protease